MSVRSLLITDSTDPDYGKISSNYLPTGTHPGNDAILATYQHDYISNPNNNGGAPNNIEEMDNTTLTEPAYIGDLINAVIIPPETNFSWIRVNCQINYQNLVIQFIGAGEGFIPPATLELSFYMFINNGSNANLFRQYPKSNLIGVQGLKTTPLAVLKYTGNVPAAPTPYFYYYSGVGYIEDYLPKQETYTTIQLYCAITKNHLAGGIVAEAGLYENEDADPTRGELTYNLNWNICN